VTKGLAAPSSVCELPPASEANRDPVDAFIPFCPVVLKCVVPAFDVWRPGPFLSSLNLQLSDSHGCLPVMYPVENLAGLLTTGYLHFICIYSLCESAPVCYSCCYWLDCGKYLWKGCRDDEERIRNASRPWDRCPTRYKRLAHGMRVSLVYRGQADRIRGNHQHHCRITNLLQTRVTGCVQGGKTAEY
jgi:hypothetical protein